MTVWFRICFDAGKTHLCPYQFRDELIAEMIERGCALTDFVARGGDFATDPKWANPRTVEEWGIDAGGMCNINRPEELFTIDGLSKFEIPSEDVAQVLGYLLQAERRSFRSGPYFKLHGHMQAIVFSPELRDSLIDQMRARIPTAEARALAFYTTEKTPSQLLANANAGKTFGLADTSGGKFTRFNRPRGKA
jgi:hypothetical protein